jgi:glycosyltransferase involved in cell wall biosynthesis
MPFLIDAHDVGAQQTGNETWIRNVSRELAFLAEPNEVAFVSSTAGAMEVRLLTDSEPLVVSGSSLRRLTLELPRAMRATRADAVLVQYTMPMLPSAPCVVMIHDLSAFEPQSKEWLSARFRLRVQASIRRSVHRAERMLAPSEFTRQQLVDICGADPDRIDISVNGVDPDLALAIDEAVSDGSSARGSSVILAVGNVLPRKNLLVLGQAVNTMRRAGEDVCLRVVGSVPAAGRDIVVALQSMLGEALSVTGYVTMPQLAGEYSRASVLAVPSLFEGFGIPVLEGLIAGLPIAVSDRAALPEVTGAAGLVVPAEDPDAWSVSLSAQLRARSSAQAEAGRAHAVSFSWRASGEATLSALRKARG